MKKSKRLLSLLLALTMAFSLVGNAAVAAWADDVPQSPETVASDNGENAPSDPDKNTDPTDNGGTGDADADKDTTDDANNGGDTKDEPAQQEGDDANGDETPADPVTVPTRKAGYPAETSATVQTGTAYLLSDLQSGKIFEPAEGQTLNYKNYYYQRSTDGGETWGPRADFSEAIFGATTIQITELTAGTYVYRFYASHDGVNFSEDTWTLTLTVEDTPTLEFSFYVGRDYNYSTTNLYPIIKLYNVEKDADGNEVLGDEIENVFLYSNFTSTLPEGEDEYDPAMGKLVSNYQMFYAKLEAGRYAYRAFAKNTDTGDYDVALGGMTLNLPTDKNVDGGAGGGNSVYLQCNSFYVSTKKTDNTYFAADEYHVRVDCPIMGCSTTMGDAYVKGNYTYYPTMLYAGGNACLYNSYAYPDIEGYIFTQNINQTFQPSYGAATKSLTINTGITLDVTVPSDATFGLYFQWNNFNTTEVAPVCADEDLPYADRWSDNGDGTKTAQYFISKGNYTWRLSDDTHVTQAGWLASQSKDSELTFSFAKDAATNRISHDFSKLGTQTSKRDEADLQVNLDPSGYKSFTGTTRVRAYRHWQLINSDAGNIMVEPDFHWNKLTGDATISPVNGGNAGANWADITAGTQDSIITVHYDSVDVDPSNHGTHGGLFPATNPERVGVIVVGGTGVTHGTADAKVAFNAASGIATTRPADWDYNYDTWFYEASEMNPAMDFTVKATGSVDVEYAFVTTTSGMESNLSSFKIVTAGEGGRYTVPLAAFNNAGTNGGTVIIKMTDDTGVSYRLVRVAKVTITSENVSNPGEPIMPGDQVKLSFKGMYRTVNKISGIFNPTTFQPTYYAGEMKFTGSLGQYQRMDNAAITVTVPEDVTFADGASTTQYTFTNGYTYGSMYAKGSPFSYLYEVTDAGVGTNFNAVTVSFYLAHYADAVVTVYQKATYTVKLNITDDSGNAVDGVTVTLLGRDGKTVTPNEDGTYTLGYGTYTYTLSKNGYVLTRGSFSLGSADAGKVQDDVLTVKTAVMPVAGAKAWDGTAKAEPAKDESGVYQISTAAELAWFAANGGSASAKLTADIDLAGYDWTPMNKLYGTFDGDGHMVKNLYINSTSYPLGIFGYLQNGAKVLDLGVSGNVTCTASSNAQAGGIAGYMNSGSSIENCYSSVNVTSKKHAGGIAGYTQGGAAITSCYASGKITTIAANECYLGGICGSFYNNTNGATLTNCYSAATVTGSGGTSSYVGGLTPSKNTANYVGSCFYLENTVTKESSKYGVTGRGTAKTETELLTLLGAAEGDTLQTALFNKWAGQVTAAADAEVKAVIDAIEAIPQPVSLSSKAKIITAEKLYNALTATQKEKVTNADILRAARAELDRLEAEQAAADKAAADAVIAKINAIGEVTLEKETAIKEARAAYDALTTVQKNLVKNDGALTTLEAAEATLKQLKADKEQADAVIGWINGLNDPITLAEEQGVQNIRKRYDSLTDAQKALVTNLDKLEKAEKQLTELKAAIADTESKIDAIGTVELTDACKAKIDAARDAYDALNKEQQAKVSNYETLTDAEAEYQKLADKAAADKAAADAVIAKISAIGTVELTADCKAKIDAAREAYTALSDEQKELVSNLKTLTDAENEYKSLADKAAADKAAANAVIDKINAIGNVTKDSGDAIKDARDAYDKLTDDQKKLVPDEILKKLTDAESTYKNLTAPRPRPSDKTNTKTDGKGVKSQNTGDNSQMTLWLSGVLLSAAALLLLAKKRRQDA